MEIREKHNYQQCQIVTLPQLCEPISFLRKWWQFRNRLKRIFKRRWIYLINLLSEKEKIIITGRQEANSRALSLEPGDSVRVKSMREIKKTLDTWNQLKGCSFLGEMWDYCGTTQQVLKRVNKFLDERDYLIKKCTRIVFLEGVICHGTRDFGDCDRSCFYFWREEWLERIG